MRLYRSKTRNNIDKRFVDVVNYIKNLIEAVKISSKHKILGYKRNRANKIVVIETNKQQLIDAVIKHRKMCYRIVELVNMKLVAKGEKSTRKKFVYKVEFANV